MGEYMPIMNKSLFFSRTLAIFLCTIACNRDALAGVADYVFTPAVEYGEREIDIKFGSAALPAGNSAQVASVGLGFGAKEYWFTEVYFKQERSGNVTASLLEWENKFQFSDPGEYAVDTGLVTELEAPLSADIPWEAKIGALFQTEFGRLQMNVNLLFKRAFGKADPSGAPYTTNFGYQLQAKYRWQPVMEFGVQCLGDMGEWNNWDEKAKQNRRIGPAVFGKFASGNRQIIKYNAAWLTGVTDAAPGHTFRMQVEYEF